MKLNKRQWVVVWLAGLVVLGMMLYPPWRGAGYSWLVSPPSGRSTLDVRRLAAQCVAAALAAGLAVALLGEKPWEWMPREARETAHEMWSLAMGRVWRALKLPPRQQWALLPGVFVCGLMLVCPPWLVRVGYRVRSGGDRRLALKEEIEALLADRHYTADPNVGTTARVYCPITHPPEEVVVEGRAYWVDLPSRQIDIRRLAVQEVIAVFLTLGGMALMRKRDGLRGEERHGEP